MLFYFLSAPYMYAGYNQLCVSLISEPKEDKICEFHFSLHLLLSLLTLALAHSDLGTVSLRVYLVFATYVGPSYIICICQSAYTFLILHPKPATVSLSIRTKQLLCMLLKMLLTYTLGITSGEMENFFELYFLSLYEDKKQCCLRSTSTKGLMAQFMFYLSLYYLKRKIILHYNKDVIVMPALLAFDLILNNVYIELVLH